MFSFEERDDQNHLTGWSQEQVNPGLNTSCQRSPSLGQKKKKVIEKEGRSENGLLGTHPRQSGKLFAASSEFTFSVISYNEDQTLLLKDRTSIWATYANP